MAGQSSSIPPSALAPFLVTDAVLHPDGSLVLEAVVDAGDGAENVYEWSVVAFRNTSSGFALAGAAFESGHGEFVNEITHRELKPTLAPARFILGTGFKAGDEIEVSFTSSLFVPGKTLPPQPVDYLWRFVPPGETSTVPMDAAAFRTAQSSREPIPVTPSPYSGSFLWVAGAFYVVRDEASLKAKSGWTGYRGPLTSAQLGNYRQTTLSVDSHPLNWGSFAAFLGGPGALVDYVAQVWEGGEQRHATNAFPFPPASSSPEPDLWKAPVTLQSSGWQPYEKTRQNALQVNWTGAPTDRVAAVFHMTGRFGDPRLHAERPLSEISGGTSLAFEGTDVVARTPEGQTWTWVRCCEPPRGLGAGGLPEVALPTGVRV